MPRFAVLLMIFIATTAFSLLIFLRLYCWLPYQYIAKSTEYDISSTEKQELREIINSRCIPHAFTSTVIIVSMMGFCFVLYTMLERFSNMKWNVEKKPVHHV